MKNYLIRNLFVIATILFIFAAGLYAQDNNETKANLNKWESSSEITPLLEEIRKEFNLPAVAAAVVRSDQIVAADAVGLRIVGKPSGVTVNDRFYMASVTKPMTATMIAVLVEKGKIRWNAKLAEVFPELRDQIHPSLSEVTLEQLLSHRAGIQPFLEDAELEKIPKFTGNTPAIRRAFAEWLLRNGTASAVGEYKYSNAGYGIAAAVAERVTGKSWESLMRNLLFKPLGMDSAGFGWAPKIHPNEPWGHQGGDPDFTPRLPKDKQLIPPTIAPAGDVHANIMDLARFAQLHLRGINGQSTALLKSTTFEKLHKPLGEYALGWNAQQIKGLPASTHLGGVDDFAASIMIYPKKNIAIVIAINAEGKGVGEARNKLIGKLLRKYKAIE